RWQAAHLRDRRILPRGRGPERRLDRAGGAHAGVACACTGRRAAGARGRVRPSHHRRSDARARQGGARLSGLKRANPSASPSIPKAGGEIMLRGRLSAGLAAILAAPFCGDANAGHRRVWGAPAVLAPGWGYYSYPWGYVIPSAPYAYPVVY